jgi:hypothetical protein
MATAARQAPPYTSSLAALAELGPVLAGERDFSDVADHILRVIMQAAGANEGALFCFCEKPLQLRAVSWRGLALFPLDGYIPLMQRHAHALTEAEGPQSIAGKDWEMFLTCGGNLAPGLFKCILPMRAAGKLAGAALLGARPGESLSRQQFEALTAIGNFAGLALYNHNLTQTLQQRVVEHLKLLDSMNGFCDQAMEIMASAIDSKEFRSSGHSLRVGRCAAALASAMRLDANEVAELRAAGYLHDIGKVAVDKRLFHKAAALEPNEFREMADHTLVGHRIISGVPLPWPSIAEVVRGHHERCDGTGYPDQLAQSQLSMPVRVVALADSFDAMVHERPYRASLSVGQALTQLVRNTPQKFDSDAVQALLACIRAHACGHRQDFLDSTAACEISAGDIDQLAADLKYKATHGRVYSA